MKKASVPSANGSAEVALALSGQMGYKEVHFQWAKVRVFCETLLGSVFSQLMSLILHLQ